MAVTGPVRTLLAAHLQAGWNRSRHELGRSGRTAYVITLIVLLLFAALPILVGSLVGGYFLGRGLPSPTAIRILGAILAFLALLGGLVGGLAGGTRVLGWENTRVFPLRLRSLFAAELIAGLGDLMPLSIALITACLLLGMAVARPLLLLFLPLAWLGTVGSVLCIQYLVGSLTARIAQHLKLVLMVLGFLLWAGSSLLPGRMLHAAKAPLPLQHRLQSLVPVLDLLPSTQCAQGMGEALAGHPGLALERLAYPFAALVLLLLAAAATLRRDSDPETLAPSSKGAKEKLWSFSTPILGVARLQWHAIVSSHLGKFQFLIPLMVLVLIKGPFSVTRGATVFSIPMAFMYLSMSGIQIQLNQFGLDGAGVKVLLLVPLGARDILAGKALGLLAFLSLQASLMLILLSLFGNLTPVQALAGLCLSGCFFCVQVGLGHWTSAWMPRAMPRNSLKNSNQAQPVIWLGMAALLGGLILFGAPYVLLAWLAPRLLLPVMAVLLGGMFLIYRNLILPATASYLETRKEALVQALG